METEKYKGYTIDYFHAEPIGRGIWTEIYDGNKHLSTYISDTMKDAKEKAHLYIDKRTYTITNDEYQRRIKKFLK